MHNSFFASGASAPSATPDSQPRSATPTPRVGGLSLPGILKQSKSTSHIPKMATVISSPPVANGAFGHDHEFPNTIPDPRSPSPSEAMRSPTSSANPDVLSDEVAMLSTKLVNAMNYQTNLDDTLHHTRHELDTAREEIARLQAETKEHAEAISAGVLVKKAEVDATMEQLRADLALARQEREAADKGKKQMELELEGLTASLFEEANTMVAAARKEAEGAEKRNAQLKNQLHDTETLLASQQEQLQDLKNVMEKLSLDRDETDTVNATTAPSTPGMDANKMSRLLDMPPPSPGLSSDVAPDHPLRFSYLISPVMRSDITSYTDFAEMLKSSRSNTTPAARSAAGSTAASRSTSNSSNLALPSSSSPAPPGAFNLTSSSPRDATFTIAPMLKDFKFYKRCVTEDIEPTLRLDLAPGLSWLARRNVVNAITAGSLVVEPFVQQSRFYGIAYACSLCGEDRRSDAYERRHRFRTSDDSNAQRYPLCEYCLGRVRATGDFTGFLRMVRDGLWRASTDEEVKSAWEESVRLRERMFWARLGGGVVPAALGRGAGDASSVANGGGGDRNGLNLQAGQDETDAEFSMPKDLDALHATRRSEEDGPSVKVARVRDSYTKSEETGDGTLSSRTQDFANSQPVAKDEQEQSSSPSADAGAAHTGPASTASQEEPAETATIVVDDDETDKRNESSSSDRVPGSFD